MNIRHRNRFSRRRVARSWPRGTACALVLLAAMGSLAQGQTTFSESFTGTSAPGWVFGANPGDTLPVLTAAAGIDAPGQGWLRLNTNATNQSTYALLDNQIFSVNAEIKIEMEYAFYNGTGADGISFFMVDGSVDSASFKPGAYGGSMGYAQKTDEAGMPGAYLGFAFDNFGNFTNDEEGRVGGYASGLHPNTIGVRGPDDGDGNNATGWDYIAGSSDLSTLVGGGQMDFPTATIRPDQTGADFRSFRLTIDANNQLTVEMKFGASANYITAFTADLAAYERPDTFKIGFTGATGSQTEIHEIRNISVTTTPWSTGSGSYEWDNGAGTTTWGTLAGGEGNSNWFATVSGDNNKTPVRDSDVLFGNKPTNNGADNTQSVQLGNNVEVRNMTFDTGINYTIGTVGAGRTIVFGDTSKPGLPSINVNDYNHAYARHKINADISLSEDIAIRNFSYSTLCLNGTFATNGNDVTVSGHGAVNFNGDITGSGDLVKNGVGIATINNNNADGSAWTGAVTVNEGMLVVTANGALGSTSAGTTVNSGGTLAFRGGVNYSTTETLTINGVGITRNTGQLAGAIHNDGGNNTFAGNIVLASNAAVGSRADNLTLSGVISESGGVRSLTKVGDGVVTLSGANTYTGATIIADGVLRVASEGSLPGGFSTGTPSGGNLTLAGGVLEIGAATIFTRRLGTSSDRVQFTGDGGFSAYDATTAGLVRTVTLTNSGGVAGGQVAWGSGSFVPTGNALLLSSSYANGTLDFTNAIDLGSQLREVRVANGSAALDGDLSGVLSGTGGLNKTGAGTLELSADNTYTGETRISGGALRVGDANRINGSDLVLNGGVLEISGDLDGSNTGEFTRAVGTTAGEDVRWSGDGGFSASGASRTVRLNNGAATVTWGTTGGFVGAGNKLIFGATSADASVTLANALDLGASGTRIVQTVRGTSSTIASGALAGAVSGAADLQVSGNGRLDLTAVNTNSGTLTVAGSEVRLTGSGSMTSATGVTVKQGGQLTLDNAGTNSADRIGAVSVTLAGGRVDILGRTSNNTATAETAGELVLSSGENQININRASNTGATTNLTFASLSRSAGATLEFTRSGSGTFGTDANVRFTAAPTLEQGILAYAVAGNGATPTGFATHSGNGTAITVSAGSNTTQASWTSSVIAAPTADQALTASRTVGALSLASAIDISGAHTLTVQTGGILSTGGTASNITVSNLQVGGTGNRELFAHVYDAGGLNISSVIQNNGNVTGLTKSGNGTLTLSGTSANTYTGVTTVNDGTVVLNKTSGVNAIAGDGNTATTDLVIGDGRGTDTVRLGANEQIANNASVKLVGGELGNSANVARLELNGAATNTDASRIETFHSLSITGNSVLDFGGGTVCSPTFLYLDLFTVASDALLTITNWIEFTDFLLVDRDTFDETQLARVIFDGYPGTARWQIYDDNYYQVTPVPEPASYGLLALGGLVGFTLTRRRRRAQAGGAC